MEPPVQVSRYSTFSNLIGLCCAVFCLFASMYRLAAQEYPANQVIRSEIKHIGSTEARAVTKDSGFFPDRQPEVYWHGEDWKIDLLPLSAPDAAFQVRITSEEKREQILTLPESFAQVDSITRTPGDKAIVIAEINGKVTSMGVVDLMHAKLIDDFALVAPSISPDGRFIIYDNTDFVEYDNYRLYDALKTPRENTCGYRANDPEHKDLDEGYRGFPIYPRWPDRTGCDDKYLEAFASETHLRTSDFIWSSDSSKVIFADVKDNKTISLILVAVPGDRKDRADGDRDGADRRARSIPQTSIYTFTGANDVCAGAASCDYNNVKSVAWNGDSVNVALIQANPGGKAIEKDLTVPLSEFASISGGQSPSPDAQHQ